MTPKTPYPVLRNLAEMSLNLAARHLEGTGVDAGAMKDELVQTLNKYAPKSGPEGKDGDDE